MALYFIFWLFPKRNVGWLIAALVFFALDTVLMVVLYGIHADMLLDALFHILILVSLAMGVSAYFKLRKLPPEEPTL